MRQETKLQIEKSFVSTFCHHEQVEAPCLTSIFKYIISGMRFNEKEIIKLTPEQLSEQQEEGQKNSP